VSLLKGVSAGSKRGAVIVALVALGGLGGVSWGGYKIWKLWELRKNGVAVETKGEITPGSQTAKIIEKSEVNEQEIIIKNQQAEIERLKKENPIPEPVAQLEKPPTMSPQEPEKMNRTTQNVKDVKSGDNPARTALPPPPPLAMLPPPPPPPNGAPKPGFFSPTNIIGSSDSKQGLPPQSEKKAEQQNALFGGTIGGGSPPVKEDVKKKPVKPAIKLPSNSFGTAYIFAGGMAPTALEGQAKGVRLLMRIDAPTQLPGRVRSILVGCFLQGAATGNLQSERADIVLTRISCVDRKRRAVIDQKIEGWVIGSDGVAGVKGPVISDLDKTLGRAFVAGMFKAAGQTLQASSTTLSVLGTSNLNPGMAAQNAIAGGVGEASNSVAQLYIKLAQLQMPVVAVGSGLKVGYVIGDGVELAINNYCDEDDVEERDLGCEEQSPSAD
jgi:conjugal transfer pilus assembly protein TraB